MKLATNFYSSQLVDMFAYELPTNDKLVERDVTSSKYKNTEDSIIVYNFHNLTFQERFYIFTADLIHAITSHLIFSITELFPNANWLEREIAELHGTGFGGKKDLRNLMLQYGDTTAPFQKSHPATGLKEMMYDGTVDLLVQIPVRIQS